MSSHDDMGLIRWNADEFNAMFRASNSRWCIGKDLAKTIIMDADNFEAHFARFFRIQYFFAEHIKILKRRKHIIMRRNGAFSISKNLMNVLVRHPYEKFLGSALYGHYVFDVEKVLEAVQSEIKNKQAVEK